MRELEGAIADDEVAAVEHTAVEKFFVHGGGGVDACVGDARVAREEGGAGDADVSEDCVAVVCAVVGHFESLWVSQ